MMGLKTKRITALKKGRGQAHSAYWGELLKSSMWPRLSAIKSCFFQFWNQPHGNEIPKFVWPCLTIWPVRTSDFLLERGRQVFWFTGKLAICLTISKATYNFRAINSSWNTLYWSWPPLYSPSQGPMPQGCLDEPKKFKQKMTAAQYNMSWPNSG